MVSKASLLGTRHLWEVVENKPASSLVISLVSQIITYGTIYRSPLCDTESHQFFMNKLKESLKLIKANNKCFMYGDFNYDLFQNDNANVNDFVDTIFDNYFYSLVNKPSRITDTSAALLDPLPVLMCFYTKETNLKQEIKT